MSADKNNRDYNLAHQYLLGDRQAGHELYAEAYPIVKAFIWSRANLFSEEDKEDILAEAMVTSKEKLDRYNGTCLFSTFVNGIARHKIQEKMKSNSHREDLSQRVISITPTNSEYDDPLEILIEKEMLEAVKIAQRMLPDNQRQVLTLRLNGVSANNVAEYAGITPDAVNSLYYRAIIAFRKYFINIHDNRDDFSQKPPLTVWRDKNANN